MPIPAFTRQTAPDPTDPDTSFLMIGKQALPFVREFGARNWLIFTALLLSSDASGLAAVSLPALTALTGYNRETLQDAIGQLSALRIGGKRVLRKVPSLKFGANRYVLFPDRDDAPLSEIADNLPKKRTTTAPPPRKQTAPVMPTRYAEEEEGDDVSSDSFPLLTQVVAGAASSDETPLLRDTQVATKPRYLGAPQVAGKDRFVNGEGIGIGEEGERSIPYDPTDHRTNADNTPAKKVAPPRDTKNPRNAADLTALYIELYAERWGTNGEVDGTGKPIWNRQAFGQRMKSVIDSKGLTAAVAMIRHFFAADHKDSAYYTRIRHAAPFLIKCAEKVCNDATGATLRAEEQARMIGTAVAADFQRKQVAALEKITADTGEDYLPAHVRAALSEGDDDAPAFWEGVAVEEEAAIAA